MEGVFVLMAISRTLKENVREYAPKLFGKMDIVRGIVMQELIRFKNSKDVFYVWLTADNVKVKILANNARVDF